MVDDYKYSVGRSVVYTHREPARDNKEYGKFGPARTVGKIRAVEAGTPPEHVWIYTMENLRTGEVSKVREPDVHYAAYVRGGRKTGENPAEAENLAEKLAGGDAESPMAQFLKMSIEEYHVKEHAEARARKEGRDLPVAAGDYIRIRGELRKETEPSHNHYAKILEVMEPDIGAIECVRGHYAIKHAYRVLVDDGRETTIYDPEVKLYYTAEGRKVILNWRAAKFLSESFHDDPPYSLDYSYMEDHVYSRDELERMSEAELKELFASLLYVKGRIGLRDYEKKDTHMQHAQKSFLVDSILAMSRFDMSRNRTLTPHEVESKRRDAYKLRRLLRRG